MQNKLMLTVAPIVLLLLGVQFAYAQNPGSLLVIVATVHRDNSNQFIPNNFAVDTFSFHTSDTSICPTGMTGCTYSIEQGAWRTNMASDNMFVFDGTVKASSGSGSNFYEIRADLTRNSENTTSDGHTLTTLSGSMSFGNAGNFNIPWATFDSTNDTLKMLGLSQ
jgi:hypothetical protein